MPVAVIPAKDAGDTISVAVRSAVAQVSRVLVIDDGSSDETAEAARRAGAEVLPGPGTGPATARNTGLRACDARYVAFLDADDEWLPGHIERASEAITATQPALVAASALRVDAAGAVVGLTMARLDPGDDPVQALLEGRLRVTTSGAVVDVSRALEAGGFDESMCLPSCEDWDLWLRLAATGRVVPISTPGVRYRVNDSLSAGARIDQVARDRERVLSAALTAHRVEPEVAKRAWAWTHVDLAAGFLKAGRRGDARARLRSALRLNRAQPRAWGLGLLSFAPPRAERAVRRLKRVTAGLRWRW